VIHSCRSIPFDPLSLALEQDSICPQQTYGRWVKHNEWYTERRLAKRRVAHPIMSVGAIFLRSCRGNGSILESLDKVMRVASILL
jgi:hypothetical protein